MRFKNKYPVIVSALIVIAVLLTLGFYEMRTSWLQAYYLSRVSGDLKFSLESGPSPSIRYPSHGPYDERLGYVTLPSFIGRLTEKGYTVEAQARFAERLIDITDWGFYTTYREKISAGLSILDRDDVPLFTVTYPERVYGEFRTIPDIIVKSLLFIENQELLDPRFPYRNPAVEWDRLARAIIYEGRHMVDRDEKGPGGSTLITQMEKYWHSPGGMTSSVREKYRQMISASLRAYLNGRNTLETRQQIVLDYINSIPLGAVPGYGQINGIGDGLYGWYGADFESVNQCLSGGAGTDDCPEVDEWGIAFKQVLSLFIAQRRPGYYFLEKNERLESRTNGFIRLLAENGVISSLERNAALRAKLISRRSLQAKRKASFVDRKAANAIRPRLISLLDVSNLYELDLIDLRVKSTIDGRIQEEVTETLSRLRDPEFAEKAELFGARLLERNDPSKVTYSFTLYERTPGANVLRIQTDNYDQPLNINEGVKLELGSSAKLRTLVTYLEVIAELHNRYASFSREQLKVVETERSDHLSRWAIDFLATTPNKSLKAMLEGAMERKYSASPAERFYTGGGEHKFSNFDDKYDKRHTSVKQAFNSSVNLVFIRMMRDIVQYYTFQRPGIAGIVEDFKDPRRKDYLERFADREGKIFLNRFYRKYKDKNFEESIDILLQGIRLTPVRLAVIYRSLKPEAGFNEFSTFIRSRLPNSSISDSLLHNLYENYSKDAYSLVDRGYIARIHPLELWTISYMNTHEVAGYGEVIETSKNERLEVYGWLFRTRWKNAQDIRIRSLLEMEAFSEIHRSWKRLGYPFDTLVPSYATSIGSSADRPAALAELVGIVLNGGVKYPTLRIQELHFAKDTPYETILRRNAENGEVVMLPEIASIIKDALTGVVEQGTAKRLHNAFVLSGGTPLTAGGKTGTGDNRHDIYGPRGRLIRSDAINRTAVFVFFIGDRFFGTITAYVPGQDADAYSFTSVLPVQVLKTLAPSLMPLIERDEKNIGNGLTEQQ